MKSLKSFTNFSSLALFSLCLTLFVFSCKDDPPVNPNQITSDYYFQAVLDGDTVTYQDGVNDYGQIIGDFYGGAVPGGYQYAPFTCVATNDAVANPSPATLAESGAVAFVANASDPQTTLVSYSGLVSTGSFDIGELSRTANDSSKAGGYISVFDANGVEWTSNGPQSNASFIVTEYSDFTDNDRSPPTRKIFAAEFSCTVYNATGNSMELTGGRVRGRMIPWQ